MTRRLIIRAPAEADIQEVFNYLEKVRPGTGARFLERLQAQIERIEDNPEAFAVVWQDVRAVRIRRYQYVAYFVAFDDRIELIAVVHGSRRSTRWQSRA